MANQKSFTNISPSPHNDAENHFGVNNTTPALRRLLYVIPRYARDLMGNQIHTEVIHYWQRQQIDVDLLCFDANAAHETFELLDNIPVYRLPISNSAPTKALNRAANLLIHYPYFPGLMQAYRRFISQHRYDFAHVETAFPLGVVASLMPKTQHPPFAVTLPGADVMGEPAYDYGYGRYATVRKLLRTVWQHAALVRADSRYIRRRAIELGCPPERVVAIPYNITDGDYPPAALLSTEFRTAARAEVRSRHGLPADANIVLSLSRLHPFKGVEFLVQAAPEVLAAVPNTYFVIVGPRRSTPRFGDYADYLEQQARELNVAEHVLLVGALPHPDVRTYMAAADAVVVPSVIEALNRVAIEAAALNTPAVVTRTTGISEYMVEHGYGLVVEPRSPESIAAALRIVLRDPQRNRALGAGGPAMAAQFRSELIAADLLAQYKQTLAVTQNHPSAA